MEDPEGAVFGAAALLASILCGLDAEELCVASHVCKLWRAAALSAARTLAYAGAPSLAAALDVPSLPPVAWLALARAAPSAFLGQLPPPPEALLPDYTLLLEVHDADGRLVWSAYQAAAPGCAPLTEEELAEEADEEPPQLPPKRAVLWVPPPGGPLLAHAPLTPLASLADTGAPIDVRRLRVSLSFLRRSTGEVARVWSGVPAAGVCAVPPDRALAHAAHLQPKWPFDDAHPDAPPPALLFSFVPANALRQGATRVPPCVADAAGEVRALAVKVYITLSSRRTSNGDALPPPPAGAPAGAQTVQLHISDTSVYLCNPETGPGPGAPWGLPAPMYASLLQSLDWEPLLPPAHDACGGGTDAEAAMHSDVDTCDYVAVCERWHAHASVLRRLMHTAVRNPASLLTRPWLRALPARPFAALGAACDAAAAADATSLHARALRLAPARAAVRYTLLCEATQDWSDRPDMRNTWPMFGAAAALLAEARPGSVPLLSASTHRHGRAAAPPPPPFAGSWRRNGPQRLLMLDLPPETPDWAALHPGTAMRRHTWVIFPGSQSVRSGYVAIVAPSRTQRMVRATTALLRVLPGGEVQMALLSSGAPLRPDIHLEPRQREEDVAHLPTPPAMSLFLAAQDAADAAPPLGTHTGVPPPHAVLPREWVDAHWNPRLPGAPPHPAALPALVALRLSPGDVELATEPTSVAERAVVAAQFAQMRTEPRWRIARVRHMHALAGLCLSFFAAQQPAEGVVQQMLGVGGLAGMGALPPGLGAAPQPGADAPPAHPPMQASQLALYDAASRMTWVTLLRPWPGGGGRSPWEAEVPAAGTPQ
jgi:hypothetical protein